MRHKYGWMCRVCLVKFFICLCVLINPLAFAHRKVPQRKLRQAPDQEEGREHGVAGVWSVWGPWSTCSQPCGVGKMERSRTCLSPSETIPQQHSYMGPRFGSLPQRTPVSPYASPREERVNPYTGHAYSALRPAYPLHTDRDLTIPSVGPAVPPNRNVGSRQPPFYRFEGPNRNSRQDALNSRELSQDYRHSQEPASAQFHRAEHASRQDMVSVRRQQDPSSHGSVPLYKPSGAEAFLPYSQENRSSSGSLSLTRPSGLDLGSSLRLNYPANQASVPSRGYQASSAQAGAAAGHRSASEHGNIRGNTQSAHPTQQSRSLKRSRFRGPIKPGTFGYGKVPFSLPLHKEAELNRRSRRNSQVQHEDPAPLQGQQEQKQIHTENQGVGSKKKQQDRSGSSKPTIPKTLHIHTKSEGELDLEALKVRTSSVQRKQKTGVPAEGALQPTAQTTTRQPLKDSKHGSEDHQGLVAEEAQTVEEGHLGLTDGKELPAFLQNNQSRIVGTYNVEIQPEDGLEAPQVQEFFQQGSQVHTGSSVTHDHLKVADDQMAPLDLTKETERATLFEKDARGSEATQKPFQGDRSSQGVHQHFEMGAGLKETSETSGKQAIVGQHERMDSSSPEEMQRQNEPRNGESLEYLHNGTLASQQSERALGTGVVKNSSRFPQAAQRSSHLQEGVQSIGNQSSLLGQHSSHKNPSRAQSKQRSPQQRQEHPLQVHRSGERGHSYTVDQALPQGLQQEPYVVRPEFGSQTRASPASRTRQHRQYQHGVYDIMALQDHRLNVEQSLRQGQGETDVWHLHSRNVPWLNPRGSSNRPGQYSNAEIHDWSLYHPDRGNFVCDGEQKQYKICNQEPCPVERPSFRATQCSVYNKQEFMGRLYEWEPFTEVREHQRCELNCRPVGYRFYVRHVERVQDGTPCELNSMDICVAGKCLSPGCDGILGSNKTMDKCGICGGDNSSCKFISGTFDDAAAPIGYHKIIEIPKGATKINITEKTASPNYLVLRSRSGKSVVNGNWAVDPPGKYEAGGTTFMYKRPSSMESGESFTAEGPTTEAMDVYMIFQEKNPGISYEFFLPAANPNNPVPLQLGPRQEFSALTLVQASESLEPPTSFQESVVNIRNPSPVSRATQPGRSYGSLQRNVRIPPQLEPPIQLPPHQQEYFWKRVGSTECSATCGKGSRYPIFRCVSRSTLEEAGDRVCDISAKPAITEEACNTHSCPAFWDANEWSECSKTCGPGIQQRQVTCRQSFANRTTMVHHQRCGQLEKPAITQPCQLRICSHWEIHTNWSSCSVLCGVGQRTRSVRCVSNNGDLIADSECNPRLRPNTSEACDMGPCVRSWFHSDWSKTCSVECGPGIQRRSVVCLSSHSNGPSLESCAGPKPAEMQACNSGPCQRQVKWFTGPWNQCSTECGVGTQRRDIICVSKLGTEFNMTDPSVCAHLEKPASIQPCEVDSCKARWYTTQWSACSKSCQGGVQMREVRCLTEEKTVSDLCDSAERPADKQECNTQPCSPELGESCRDKYHNCPVVVQARLCVYSYYSMMCCASCTRAEERRTRRHQ